MLNVIVDQYGNDSILEGVKDYQPCCDLNSSLLRLWDHFREIGKIQLKWIASKISSISLLLHVKNPFGCLKS